MCDWWFEYHTLGVKRFSLLRSLWLAPTVRQVVVQPWRVITYLFVHENLLHLFVNVLLLYFLGLSFESMLGSKRLLVLFFLSGVVTGFCYPLVLSLSEALGYFPLRLPLVGASGAILSVLVAEACFAPQKQVNIFGLRFRLIGITILLVMWSLLTSTIQNMGGFYAHFGGILVGCFYGFYLRFSGLRYSFGWLTKGNEPIPNTENQLNIVYVAKYDLLHRKRAMKYNREQRMNSIMEKIKTSGYMALTDEEKQELYEQNTNKN